MSAWTLRPDIRKAVASLHEDLGRVFGARLDSLVVYGVWVVPSGSPPAAATRPSRAEAEPVHSVALVQDLSYGDLAGCAERADSWEQHGCAMPLLLSRAEFARSLDAFPLEFGDIIARHVVLAGADPFEGVRVDPQDLRRACEVQARSHLIHLREGFLETAGRDHEVARLVRDSIPSLRTLVGSLARLDALPSFTPGALAEYAERELGVPNRLVRWLFEIDQELTSGDATQLFPPYHDVTAELVRRVDRWKGP
jgi:hypothetical protein